MTGADLPRPGRPVAAVQERMLAAAGRAVRARRISLADGPDLQVLEAGEGAPVILLHGSAGCGLVWLPLIEQMGDHRLVAVDRPGYGLSDPVDYRGGDPRRIAVEVLTGLLDRLGLDQVDVVGNSAGGLWALWLAQDRPERVRRLVLAGAAPMLPGTHAPLMLRLLATPVLGAILSRHVFDASPASVRKTMQRMGEGDTVSRHPGMLEVYVAQGRDPITIRAVRGELRSLAGGLKGPAPELRVTDQDLRRLAHPVLLVWGRRDPIGEVKVAERAARLLPDARLELVDGGHLPWWGEPAYTAQLLTDFLAGC